jgi:hypothetical protein
MARVQSGLRAVPGGRDHQAEPQWKLPKPSHGRTPAIGKSSVKIAGERNISNIYNWIGGISFIPV